MLVLTLDLYTHASSVTSYDMHVRYCPYIGKSLNTTIPVNTSVVTMNSAMFSKCIVNKVHFLTMAGTGVLAPAGRMLHWQAIKTSKPQHYSIMFSDIAIIIVTICACMHDIAGNLLKVYNNIIIVFFVSPSL